MRAQRRPRSGSTSGFAHLQPSRARQAGLRAVGRAPARAARAVPDDEVPARPGAAGVRRALAAAASLEPDFGAVVSLGLVLVGLLWAGGMPLRYFGWFARSRSPSLIALHGQGRARTGWPGSPSFLDPFADPTDGGYQAVRGMYALATGGCLGRRAGQQRDEVGPAAARGVRLHLRDHRRGARLPRLPGRASPCTACSPTPASGSPGARPTGSSSWPASAITVWLVGQAAMNMGYVVGLLPVTGVPAAADLRRRHVAGAHPVHRRPARPVRPVEPAAIEAQRSRDRGRLARLLLPVPERPSTPCARAAGPRPPAGPPRGRRRPHGRARPRPGAGRGPRGDPTPGAPPASRAARGHAPRRPGGSGDAAPLSVVLAGGGTGGHIEPMLALADALRRRPTPADAADHLPGHRARHGDPAGARPAATSCG